MHTQKVEIPVNPTARTDKGSDAPGLTFDETVQAAEALGATGDVAGDTRAFLADLANNDAPVIVHEAPAEPKEGSDGKRRR